MGGRISNIPARQGQARLAQPRGRKRYPAQPIPSKITPSEAVKTAVAMSSQLPWKISAGW